MVGNFRRKARDGLARAISWVKQPILGCFGFGKVNAAGRHAQVAPCCNAGLGFEKERQSIDEGSGSSVDEAPARQIETDYISAPITPDYVCPKTKILCCDDEVETSFGSTPAKESRVVGENKFILSDLSCDVPFHVDILGRMIVCKSSIPSDLPELGEGSYGSVFLAGLDGKMAALKLAFQAPDVRGDKARISDHDGGPYTTGRMTEDPTLRNELHILQSLDHPNIIRPLGSVIYSLSVPAIAGMVLPFYSEGSLRSFMKRRGAPLEMPLILELAIDVFRGLDYLRSRNIAHFDVKPENILIANEDGRLSAVLADFGLATKADPSGDFGLQLGVGTPGYLPPEMLGDLKHAGHASDVYSAALTILTMLTGEEPFRDWSLHLIANKPQMRLSKVADLDPDLRTVLMNCLRRNPRERPTSMEVLKVLQAVKMMSALQTAGS